jgi:arylsulfatase A-like enzyme
MAGPWDAPLELRNQYADAEDPLPPESVEVPCRRLDESVDPDEVLGVNHAYAGQVSLLDTLCGALVDGLEESPLLDDTLLVFLSARGFPLGEHQRLGPVDEMLANELVHVPLILRFPHGLGAGGRSPALVQLPDLAPTILDWLGLERLAAPGGRSAMPLVRDEQMPWRDCVRIVSSHDQAVRTPAWYLRTPLDAGGRPELFSKPSDRWEVNDVADRLPQITAALLEVLAETEPAGQPGQRSLPPELVEID